MVVGPNARGPVRPACGTRIQRDVNSGVVDEEGDSVPVLQSFQPPDDILLESLLQVDMFEIV